ncbi:hypothetical protein [Streptomyces tsukubensis]|uniref:hypothetical protein n=1 Tax=Streptomyces tsukubensis TaxID=83656 RepID=UPI00344B8A85
MGKFLVPGRAKGAGALCAVLLLSGCMAVEVAAGVYPTGDEADPTALVRSWSGDGSLLELQQGGTFTAQDLAAGFMNCPEGENGSVKLSGSGTWLDIPSASNASTVHLEFTSGCTTSLTFGKFKGKPVLWNEHVEGILVILE